MPVYKAPVEDVMFLLNDVFPIERHNNLPGFADATPDTVEAILEEGAKLCEEVFAPLNLSGDQEGCTRNPDGSVTTPKGFKEAYEAYCCRRLDGAGRAGGVRRAGTALRPQHDHAGIRLLGEPGARHVSGPDAGRHRCAPGARHRGAEEDLSAEDDRGRLDRHHEPHRAPLRHGSRPAQDQGGAERRRLLCHLRHQDLHLRRRARHGGEHRPSGARPHRGRAPRHQGHLALRGAEVPRQRRRLARRPQRRRLRLPRAQDGHPRQRHLRHELRRRARAGSSARKTAASTPCS